MTKTRITRISKRSLSTIMAFLIMLTAIGFGSLITTNAASSTYTVYFRNNGSWSNVYVLTGSNLNMRGSSGAYEDLYGSNINNFTAMSLVPGESNVYKASVTVYDNKIAFANMNSTNSGYYNANSNSGAQVCCVGNMASGKVVNMWTDNWTSRNNAAYKKYNLEDYTPPVPNITGINGDWNNGNAMTLDSGNNYYYAFTGDGYDKYFRFKSGSTYYEAYSGDFNLETDGTYKPYDGSTDNKKYGTRSGNSNAFKLSANAGYNYRIYFDISGKKCWFTKTARTFTATLNKNNGSGGTNSVTATYGSAMPSATMPTREGYTFAGYYDTSASSGGTQYYTAAGASAKEWDKTTDTTLYARWTANTYTVTLNKNNGTGGTNSVTATYDSAMPSATMPTRDGYNFAGYYDTSATSGGTQYYTAAGASARTWNKASDTTLYARWTLKTYTITYKSGDNATGSDYTATKTHGSDLTLRDSTYSRTGYNQTGWSVNSDGSTKDYNLNGSYTANAAATLYPYWELKSYSVTLSETNASGGIIKADGHNETISTITHGSHTLRVDAPSGWEISSISSSGATWTNNESYAVSGSVNITGNYSISVTYVRSSNPALNVKYIDASGSTVNASTGPITAGSAHYLEVTFTNQNTFTVGTSYSWSYTKGGVQQASGSGSTANSSSAITLKSWGAIDAGTYVFTVTAGTKTKSITVNVNQSRKLTVTSVDHTSVSGSYTSEFGESKSITSPGDYWCNDGTSYTVTYTADSDYCFSSSSNSTTTSTDSGTISAAHTATTPTVYEKKFTLTKVKYATQANGTTSSSSTTMKRQTVTGEDVASGTVTGYYVTSWQVTGDGTVYVNGTAYTSGDEAQSIEANQTTYTLPSVTLKGDATVRFNYTERSYTLTKKKKLGSATAANIGTQACYRVTKSTVTAPAITGYKVTSWQVTKNTVYVNGTAYNSDSGVQSITPAASYDLTNVTLRSTATIQFNYAEDTYAVTVQSATQGTKALGTVSPSSVTAGVDTKPTITATAKTGYEFVNWTGSNVTFTNANNSSTTVSATAAGTATAKFRRTRLYLDVSANSTWKGATYYKAYFFQNGNPYTTGTTNGFISMTAVDGVEDLYYVDLPGTFNTLSSNYGFIFIAKTDNNNDWNNKTAQTANLTFDQQKNKYVIGASSNSWAGDAYFPPNTYSVIVNAAEHGTVGGATTQTIQVPDEGDAYTLPAPQASYGYKFTGWEVVSGSINYNNTTYTSGVFSENATTAITANQASTVRANFDYNDNMNLYIVGRFRVYNTYTGSPRTPTYVGGSSGAWSTTATNIKFQWNETNHYYYVDTNSSIAELSATLTDKQYFRVYDQSNSRNWQLSANQALTEANEGTQYTMTESGDKSFYFNETSNSNGPVKVCFDPVTNKLWFTIPARHTAELGTISRTVRSTTTTDTNGGTVKINNGTSSINVSEGTNYAIKVTPVSGYQLTALTVNGTSIISGHENATSEFTINRAMGEGNSSYKETVSATFTAIQYSVTVGSNSTNSSNTVKFKVNSDSTQYTEKTDVTVADTITPVVAVNSSAGYNISSIKLQEKTGTSSYTDRVQLANNSATQMKAYNARIYVAYGAISPVMSNSIAATTGASPENISVSTYTINNAYAGQAVTITPSVTTNDGTITYASSNLTNGYGTATLSYNSSTKKFTFTSPKYIGDSADANPTYTFRITPTNTPETGISASGTYKTVTIKVIYSTTQQAYMNLKTKYDEYAGYEITSDDIESGWSDFNSAMTTANTALGTFPNSIPEWNASDSYTAKKTALETAYSNLVFKETTIYVLSKYEHSNSSYVNIYLFNNSTATHDPSPIFYTDTSLTTINNTARNYHMTYEGETNDHKHLYSFTYRGHQEFIIYRRSSETDTLTDGAKLTGDIDLRNTTNYPYGEYYIDVKNTDVTSSPSVTSASTFTDFSISATGADSDLMVGQCKEGATGYTVSQIQSWLGITFNGSLASTSSQTVAQTYTITGPVGRGVPTEATVDSDHNWVPLKPGRYTVSLNASLGTDERASAGATFTGSKSTVGDTQTVLDLFVAFDDIEIYADMNGNVGTPTIHFTYTDNQGQDADLPYEFDMVTGSESIYSYTISVSTLRDVYHIDLLNGAHTETVGGETITYRAAQVSKISIDSVDIENSSFSIARDAARTGTLWLKADSSNMKTFNKIAYGSSTRTFKAVLRNGNTDTDFNNTFAEVNGTGIITDELVGDSYQYTSFYAAKDATANYDFSYTLRAKAETDITHKDGNTTNYYYFDHWESINGTTTNTNPAEASGTDVNILKAPNYATDADVTYVAVYKLTSIQKRVEITYKFKDYDTDDENYVYDPDKPLKDATYTKTVNWDGTTALSTVARNSCPIIKSNYFDYTFDVSTANVTTTQSEDPNTHKTCITAELKQTPHKYKIILGSTTHKGYYQQSVTLTAAGSNYKWYVKDANNNKIFIGNGQTYNARFGVYQDAGPETESGVSYQYDICTIYNESGTAAINSSIVPAHQEVYYDNDTPKVRHNFFIIDAYDNSGEFVGAGVLYATTDSSGNYRQSNAATVLGSTNSVNTNGISNFITGVLNPNNNINTAKYNTEFKAQTINNIGFRYLPYSGNESIIRYSNELKAYMYTFAGENTNSASMQGQKLRVFSFFVYKNGNTYTNVVSNMYAQVERYIPQS